MIANTLYNNAGTHVLKFNVLIMLAFQTPLPVRNRRD